MGERRVGSRRRVLIIASESVARRAIRTAVRAVPSCQIAAEAQTVHQATMLLTRGVPLDAVVVHAPVLGAPEAAVLRWTLRRAGVTAIVVLDNGRPSDDGELLARVAVACGVHDLHATLERLG